MSQTLPIVGHFDNSTHSKSPTVKGITIIAGEKIITLRILKYILYKQA